MLTNKSGCYIVWGRKRAPCFLFSLVNRASIHGGKCIRCFHLTGWHHSKRQQARKSSKPPTESVDKLIVLCTWLVWREAQANGLHRECESNTLEFSSAPACWEPQEWVSMPLPLRGGKVSPPSSKSSRWEKWAFTTFHYDLKSFPAKAFVLPMRLQSLRKT